FLGLCGDDSRRTFVLVQLGECYLQLGRAVEARAAAMEAMRRLDQLDRPTRQRARILDATSALAVGDLERAFHDLEVEVRRDPERTPELIMFLADKFLEVGWFQKAV